MKPEDIVKFQDSIADMSLSELEEKRDELKNKLSKMVFDDFVVMQLSLIESRIREKGE